jgi:hypothetical protein
MKKVGNINRLQFILSLALMLTFPNFICTRAAPDAAAADTQLLLKVGIL